VLLSQSQILTWRRRLDSVGELTVWVVLQELQMDRVQVDVEPLQQLAVAVAAEIVKAEL
jgi:hypothetical protein